MLLGYVIQQPAKQKSFFAVDKTVKHAFCVKLHIVISTSCMQILHIFDAVAERTVYIVTDFESDVYLWWW